MLGMRSKIRALPSSEGQTLVEFAFLLPLLAIIIVGIMEFGMIMYNKAVVTNACREGARYAIAYRVDSNNTYAPLTDAEISTIVNNYAANRLINAGSQTISVSVSPAARTEADRTNPLTVTAAFNYNYLFLSPFAPVLGNTINLGARSIMRME